MRGLSLADTIGLLSVVIGCTFAVVRASIEFYWHMRQRVDHLRAQTLQKRRALGLPDEVMPVVRPFLG